MDKYGIVVVGYNRVESIKRILERLNICEYFGDEITLIISIDNSGSEDVTEYANSYKWKHGRKIVKAYPKRLGLKNHILACGNYINEYNFDAIAVFEDDVYPSKGFYNFMKQSVEYYQNDNKIAGISLYTHLFNVHSNMPFCPLDKGNSDVFFMQFAQSWGQIWMKDSWNKFYNWYKVNEVYNDNLDIPLGVVNWPKTSWLKYHIKYCIEQNKYFVYPYSSLTTCFADKGEHALTNSTNFQVPLELNYRKIYKLTEFNSKSVIYDAFFENCNMKVYIDDDYYIGKDDFTCDLYGYKRNKYNKKYLISTERKQYKCIKSYGMELRPWEINIINDIKGNEIFIYEVDYVIKDKSRFKKEYLNTWIYFQKQIPEWSIIFELIKYKIRYKVNLIQKRKK